MEPVEAVLAIIGLISAGKWDEAGPMILRLIASLWESLSASEKAAVFTSAGFAAFSARKARSDELCADLKASLGPQEGFQAINIKELAKIILPILIALAKLFFEKAQGPG